VYSPGHLTKLRSSSESAANTVPQALINSGAGTRLIRMIKIFDWLEYTPCARLEMSAIGRVKRRPIG